MKKLMYLAIIVCIIVCLLSTELISKTSSQYDSKMLQNQKADETEKENNEYNVSVEDVVFIADLIEKIREKCDDPNSKYHPPWSLEKKSYVPLLIPALQDKNNKVRYYAMKYLNDIGDKACIPYIRAIMIDEKEDEYLRSRAIDYLSSESLFDEASIPYFKKYLSHESKLIKARAVRALADAKDKDSLDSIREILEKSTDEDVIITSNGAIEDLADFDENDASMHFLLLNLFDERHMVQLSTIKSLEKFGNDFAVDLLKKLQKSLELRGDAIKYVIAHVGEFADAHQLINKKIDPLTFCKKLEKAEGECNGLVFIITESISKIEKRIQDEEDENN